MRSWVFSFHSKENSSSKSWIELIDTTTVDYNADPMVEFVFKNATLTTRN